MNNDTDNPIAKPTRIRLIDALALEPKLVHAGVEYLTVAQFAKLIHASPRSIQGLIQNGNRAGKLPSVELAGKTWIDARQLFRYSFAECGRHGRLYSYDEDGNRQFVFDEIRN